MTTVVPDRMRENLNKMVSFIDKEPSKVKKSSPNNKQCHKCKVACRTKYFECNNCDKIEHYNCDGSSQQKDSAQNKMMVFGEKGMACSNCMSCLLYTSPSPRDS